MSESWETKLKAWKEAKDALPPLTALPRVLPAEMKKPLEADVPTTVDKPTATESGGSLLRNLLIVLGIGVGAVVLATLVLLRATKSN